MDPYLWYFDGAKIRLLFEQPKSKSNYLQTQGFASAPFLYRKCDWLWTTINGKPGYKVVSKATGNYIFLPAAQISGLSSRYQHLLNNSYYYGWYWSSTCIDEIDYEAYCLLFGQNYISSIAGDLDISGYVRAVCVLQ